MALDGVGERRSGSAVAGGARPPRPTARPGGRRSRRSSPSGSASTWNEAARVLTNRVTVSPVTGADLAGVALDVAGALGRGDPPQMTGFGVLGDDGLGGGEQHAVGRPGGGLGGAGRDQGLHRGGRRPVGSVRGADPGPGWSALGPASGVGDSAAATRPPRPPHPPGGGEADEAATGEPAATAVRILARDLDTSACRVGVVLRRSRGGFRGFRRPGRRGAGHGIRRVPAEEGGAPAGGERRALAGRRSPDHHSEPAGSAAG